MLIIEIVSSTKNEGTLDEGTLTWTYDLQIQSGESVQLMHLSAQNFDLSTVANEAMRLAEVPRGLLQGLTAFEALHIVNFGLLPDTDNDGLRDCDDPCVDGRG